MTLHTNWVLFQATVPESAMPELTRCVAELTARAAEPPEPPETTRERVWRLMSQIGSPDGRRMVQAIARHALFSEDRWVSWEVLPTDLDLTARRASGVLGGVQKALKGERLFERTTVASVPRFRMDQAVAEIILREVP